MTNPQFAGASVAADQSRPLITIRPLVDPIPSFDPSFWFHQRAKTPQALYNHLSINFL
jgi:hypothetical protein